MNDLHPEDPADSGAPIPRDLPDQQATADEDPWDVVGGSMQSAADEHPDPRIPDTDEAGTGRRGAPHSGHHHPEHPVPDEPAG
ncbi:hypothetical protein OG244_02125 [Streptomyces brevispora]|uniref:hypothetical protein n=1 Tax=Streptomyces brevispora TaxID=887462 RepID=UPI002E30C990|nr:hypothetical protein [Streptomyces brevispora]